MGEGCKEGLCEDGTGLGGARPQARNPQKLDEAGKQEGPSPGASVRSLALDTLDFSR